ncbi:DNA-directed RNA polymerase subunit omega [Rubeoparvulum massiliense]|uniref:DNA-directed RNA polymerase subunit omega n=1 Tax=Rubeoparvulum massiliense TaxID=1631346 RepID=UPI00065DFEB6|nr:DNA-directed RNA polymerase subunit omega [Rubeoparvulum massiliense]
MMLYPSIDTLVEKAESKYTIVTIAAKRARKLQEGESPILPKYNSQKFVGMALEEFVAGKLLCEQSRN